MSAPDLTVAIMAYNEVESLEITLLEIHGVLTKLHRPFDLLVVDDGSTDGTEGVADRLASALASVRTIHHAGNQGLGGVYRTGFAEARGDFLSFFPADGQFPASILPRFLDHASTHDLVLGYLETARPTLTGRLLSAAERLAYRGLVGPMPRFQGVFMVRRDRLHGLPLRSAGRGWAVVLEMILRLDRAGARVTSVPTPVRPRAAGRSKVQNLRTIAANLRQVIDLGRVLRN